MGLHTRTHSLHTYAHMHLPPPRQPPARAHTLPSKLLHSVPLSFVSTESSPSGGPVTCTLHPQPEPSRVCSGQGLTLALLTLRPDSCRDHRPGTVLRMAGCSAPSLASTRNMPGAPPARCVRVSAGIDLRSPLQTAALQSLVHGVQDRDQGTGGGCWGRCGGGERTGVCPLTQSLCALSPGPRSLSGQWVCPPALAGLTWNGRGICGSLAPCALGPRLPPASLEASSARVSGMKRHAERAARLTPDPEGEVWLCRQSQKLLPVREEGDPAVRRRPGLKQWRSQRPQRLSKELWAEGWGAPNQCVLGLGRLYLAHLLGVGGGRAKEREPGSEGLARRGAAWQPWAWEKQRVAGRGEKCRREDLVRPQPCRTKSRRTVVGMERKSSGKVTGWPHPPRGRPEKHKGTGGSSRKTRGGCCPADPRASRGLAVGKLWTAVGAPTVLGEREEGVPRAGRRQPERTACLVPGPKSNGPGQCPQGQVDNLAQLWPVSSTPGGGASPQAPLCQRSGKSRWQRELESAFEELFNMNRQLKRHLSLHLASGLGPEVSPREERGSSGVHGHRGEMWREMPAAADAEVKMGPAGEAASHPSPRTNLQKALSKLENQASQRVVRPTFEGLRTLSSPGAGTPVGEDSLPWGHTASRHGLPRLDTHPLQQDPQGQADLAGPVAPRQKQKTEQRRPAWLELLEPPEMCLEAHGQTECRDERRAETRGQPAPSQAASSPDQEKEGARGCSPASPPATSSTDDDDSRHSQMIRDRQQQILEQNKLHKQFLEEARKRLREFQSVC